MVLHSPLSKEDYLDSLQENMGYHFDLGSERFTGFFAGSFFYVTHHAGYEWNRRYSNQKNAAMGYVKKNEAGCEVHFLRFRGTMCPLVFLPLFLFMGLLLSFSALVNRLWHGYAHLLIWGIAFAVTAITAPISALMESMTERGEDGRRSLLSILMDPTDPYKNYNRIP